MKEKKKANHPGNILLLTEAFNSTARTGGIRRRMEEGGPGRLGQYYLEHPLELCFKKIDKHPRWVQRTAEKHQKKPLHWLQPNEMSAIIISTNACIGNRIITDVPEPFQRL